MIFFVTVKLDEDVHAGCLGFTNTIFKYVMADVATQVPDVVEAWYRKKVIRFDRVASVSVAQQQNPDRYCFPEQIIGYSLS